MRAATWGVGSDLDLVAVVKEAREPFVQRPFGWPLHLLPVPAELLVYTAEEWERLMRAGGRFAAMLRSEVLWVYEGPEPTAAR